MTHKRQQEAEVLPPRDDLTGFACPHEECCNFNRFAAGNLTVCERIGKDQCPESRPKKWLSTMENLIKPIRRATDG